MAHYEDERITIHGVSDMLVEQGLEGMAENAEPFFTGHRSRQSSAALRMFLLRSVLLIESPNVSGGERRAVSPLDITLKHRRIGFPMRPSSSRSFANAPHLEERKVSLAWIHSDHHQSAIECSRSQS